MFFAIKLMFERVKVYSFIIIKPQNLEKLREYLRLTSALIMRVLLKRLVGA